MSELKLSRPVERWQNCDPEVMAMQSEAALRFAFADMRHDILALHKELERLRAQVAELEDQKEAVIQQAQIWKQEARTMRNIVAECYQAVTGSAGEPGDWNGANPVRECIENLRAENARLSGRFTFTDEQAASVARAFWRRIQPYVYAEREAPYPKEFGAEIPVEFQAHMGTALLALHLHRKPDSEAG